MVSQIYDLGFNRWRDEGRQIVEYGRQIGDNASANQWRIGDWWNAGERYGQKTQTAKELGLKPATCRNLGYVAQAFNVSRRRETLSFDHHRTVISRDQAEQDRLLNWCLNPDGSRQTVAQLRAEIKRRQPLSSPAVNLNGQAAVVDRVADRPDPPSPTPRLHPT